jgi:hypothetical protein
MRGLLDSWFVRTDHQDVFSLAMRPPKRIMSGNFQAVLMWRKGKEGGEGFKGGYGA